MAGPSLFDIDGILRSVDGLLDAIDAEAEQHRRAVEGPGTEASLHGEKALRDLLDPRRDGTAEVRIAPDRMTAWVDLYPPTGRGEPLSYEALRKLLTAAGVVHGVLEDDLRAAVAAAGPSVAPNVPAARGTPPVDAAEGRWELAGDLAARRADLDADAHFVDLKDRTPFLMVRTGELLAVRCPPQEGVPGVDVTGEPLAFVRSRRPGLCAGKNVAEDAEGLRAQRSGCLKTRDGRLWVDQVLVLESGVGYETGHIDFDGDVHLTGEIAPGFRLWASGHLYSTRVIDATEVRAGGDVVTRRGIIGRNGCSVKAGGRIRAKFLEGVFAAADGSVEVANSVLNSVVQSGDRIVVGDRGLVIGGRLCAQNGLDLFQVGTDRGAKAELVAGMDFAALERINWARDQSVTLVKQIRSLEAFKRQHPDQAAALDTAAAKARAQVLKLAALARNLAPQVDRNDDAEIRIRGVVYPGTLIEICHVTSLVSRPVAKVRFVLDKRRGQIRELPL